MNSAVKGRSGELIVARILAEDDYEIVARNFRTRTGEVDLFAMQDETLVAIEIKSWDVFEVESLEQSISAKKRASIIRTTREFMRKHAEYRNFPVRFDVVLLHPKSGEYRHYKHAFTETNSGW